MEHMWFMSLNLRKMKFNFKQSKKNKVFLAKWWRDNMHEYLNPTRDWTIGLFVAVLLFVLGIGYIGFDFYIQFGAPKDIVYIETQSVGYRDVEVKRYAEQYDERERIFRELQQKKPVLGITPENETGENGTIPKEPPFIEIPPVDQTPLLAEPELGQ